MPTITDLAAYAIDLPLKEAFETAQGRKTSSPAVVVELRLSDGSQGIGSATPVKYVTGEDIDSVLAAVQSVRDHLVGLDISNYQEIFSMLLEAIPSAASARAGIEIAAVDAYCRSRNKPMCGFFGGALASVETDITIPITSPQNARKLAHDAAVLGFRSLKLKVGSKDTDEDMARVIALSEGAPDCLIRMDANQGFTPDAAVRFVDQVVKAGVKLDMLEQPVHKDDLEGLVYVTRRSSVPVFADESVIIPSDAVRLVDADAVHGINIKLMKSGISGALEIISTCRTYNKDLMLGCMIETGIGIAAAVHLACGTGAFGRLDLDAHLLVSPNSDPFPGGFTHEGPILTPSYLSGHGI